MHLEGKGLSPGLLPRQTLPPCPRLHQPRAASSPRPPPAQGHHPEFYILRSLPPGGLHHPLSFPFSPSPSVMGPKALHPSAMYSFLYLTRAEAGGEGVTPGPASLSGPGNLSSVFPWDRFALVARLHS